MTPLLDQIEAAAKAVMDKGGQPDAVLNYIITMTPQTALRLVEALRMAEDRFGQHGDEHALEELEHILTEPKP